MMKTKENEHKWRKIRKMKNIEEKCFKNDENEETWINQYQEK